MTRRNRRLAEEAWTFGLFTRMAQGKKYPKTLDEVLGKAKADSEKDLVAYFQGLERQQLRDRKAKRPVTIMRKDQ